MTDLIDTLKYEHKILIDALNNIKKLGIDSIEGQEKLLNVKTLLLKHLKKEDTKLYSILKKEAEINYEFFKTLNLFAQDMEEISKFAFLFFTLFLENKNKNLAITSYPSKNKILQFYDVRKPYIIRLSEAGCNAIDCFRIIFARAMVSPSKMALFK